MDINELLDNLIIDLNILNDVDLFNKYLKKLTLLTNSSSGIIILIENEKYIKKAIYSTEELNQEFYNNEFKLQNKLCMCSSHIFDNVVKNKSHIIINDFDNTSLPEKHININNFIAIPIIINNNIIGIIGLANSTTDYTETTIHNTQNIIKYIQYICYLNIFKIKLINNNIDFISNISHNIRTPLNGIIGITKVLYNTEINQEQIDLLKIIGECGLQLLKTVNNLLDYTRLINGRITLKSNTINFKSFITNLVDDFKLNINNNIEFKLIFHKNIPSRIITDKNRLYQILFHVINNATKYTSEGSIIVEINNNILYNNTNEIIFTITDTGCGISTEVINNILNPSVIYDTDYLKTGIGLTICKYITELLGGKMNIESTINVGTKITLSIITDNNKDITDLINKFKKKNILIFDKNTVSKITLINTLLKLKVNPICCSSVDEINLYIKNYSILLIILDNDLLDECNNILISKLIISDLNINNSNLIRPLTETQIFDKLSNLNIHNDRKIIIAEDMKSNQTVLEYTLKSLNYYDFKIVNNGKELIDELDLDINKYNTILLDLKMPVMSGIDVIEYLQEKYDNYPEIIILSASDSTYIIDKCTKLGVTKFIEKPINTKLLKDFLEN